MAGNQIWWVDGRKVQLQVGPFNGDLLVDGEKTLQVSLRKKSRQVMRVGDRALTVEVTRNLMGAHVSLLGANQLIPPSFHPVMPRLAPEDALCAAHPEAHAKIACVTCGTFCCQGCTGVDGAHCIKCLAKKTEAHAKDLSKLGLVLPIIAFAIFGGLLGAVLGGLATAAVHGVNKLTERKGLRVLAAVLIYGVALVALVAIAALISLQKS